MLQVDESKVLQCGHSTSSPGSPRSRSEDDEPDPTFHQALHNDNAGRSRIERRTPNARKN
ncbi:hypothetical protein PAXRUDRAFT_834134 [Paxillus rubicundulus Ve08.2h10]|uniref:Uncharacterized protein n=1 Tax=Paxillus rubicundulus Ve08.2h10 TaxID=930991 RepID=A0A0D0DLY3_9AGAM|nr:hypothetical protein PAXRUDRAFT_834134 [Paxillus rubicundulus Ve08.2h10]